MDAPYAFGSSFEFESKQPNSYWKDWSLNGSTSNTFATLIAFADQTLVGIGGGKVNGDDVEIVAIWVDPEFRRLGIGKKIIQKIQNIFQVRKYSLWVSTENSHAIALYKELGFKDTGVRGSQVRDPNILEMKMERVT